MSFVSLFKVIKLFIPDLKKLFWIAASVADAANVSPNGIKALYFEALNTFSIKSKAVYINISGSLPKNLSDCLILCNWVLDNFILANELFGKAFRSFDTFVLENNNLCGKLVWSLESSITFDEKSKVTWVPILVFGFNLLSCK